MLNFTTIMGIASALMQATNNPEFAKEGEQIFRECAEAIERGKRLELALVRIERRLDLLASVYPIDVENLRIDGPGGPELGGFATGGILAVRNGSGG